jgi:hypothetical protein
LRIFVPAAPGFFILHKTNIFWLALLHCTVVYLVQEVLTELGGKDRVKILCMGTQADLDILAPHLAPYGAR